MAGYSFIALDQLNEIIRMSVSYLFSFLIVWGISYYGLGRSVYFKNARNILSIAIALSFGAVLGEFVLSSGILAGIF